LLDFLDSLQWHHQVEVAQHAATCTRQIRHEIGRPLEQNDLNVDRCERANDPVDLEADCGLVGLGADQGGMQVRSCLLRYLVEQTAVFELRTDSTEQARVASNQH
jgi:hypothetical protein